MESPLHDFQVSQQLLEAGYGGLAEPAFLVLTRDLGLKGLRSLVSGLWKVPLSGALPQERWAEATLGTGYQAGQGLRAGAEAPAGKLVPSLPSHSVFCSLLPHTSLPASPRLALGLALTTEKAGEGPSGKGGGGRMRALSPEPCVCSEQPGEENHLWRRWQRQDRLSFLTLMVVSNSGRLSPFPEHLVPDRKCKKEA